MRGLILALMLLPLAAQAGGGAWNASASGPPLANRGSWQRSQPLVPPADIAGEVSVISWRYQLSRPAPSGLEVRLCGEQRCTTLEGASGITRGLAHLNASETLHMVFGFAGSGALPPGLRVVSSEVMVNYE
ncbi:flagellar protein FlhE [Pantoea graminicola]|uniref:flagellar protein FlhE n=1 Tax=unclassified Pantoea TaxID=2630326 RepID=UPI000DA93DD0|nr:flagellar protein FlhE [Pantoea sp. ARC607]PZL95446.1 flagellar protein FlhE [Pantoea sp. ARC607]